MPANLFVEVGEYGSSECSQLLLVLYIRTEVIEDFPDPFLHKLISKVAAPVLISIHLPQPFRPWNEPIEGLFDDPVFHPDKKLLLKFATSVILVINSYLPLVKPML